jgi:CheY-like chemotaxis protein
VAHDFNHLLSVITGQGETILLAEDDAPILDLAKTMLEALGYTVLAAATLTA